MDFTRPWIPGNQITQSPTLTVTVNAPSEKPPECVDSTKPRPRPKAKEVMPMRELLPQIETALDDAVGQIDQGSLELSVLSGLRSFGRKLEVTAKASEGIDPEIAKMLEEVIHQLNGLTECDTWKPGGKFKGICESIFSLIEKVNDRDRALRPAVKLSKPPRTGQLREIKPAVEKQDPEVAEGFHSLLSSLQSLVLPPV
jgi:hypothetical protein